MSQANLSQLSTSSPSHVFSRGADVNMEVSTANYGFPKPTEVIASLVYFSILSCAIVIGNLLVITAYERNWRLKTITNTFIVGLAVADLIVGVVSIPGWIYVFTCHYFDRMLHPAAYEFYITLDIFIGCASIFQLTAISIERCIAIVCPLRHRVIHPGRFHFMIFVAWGVAAFVAALYPIQLGSWERVYSTVSCLMCFAGPLIVMLVVYFKIYETAVKSKTRVSPSGTAGTLHREIRVASTVALVTGLFIFAWLPFFVVTVMATYDIESLPEPPYLVRLIAVVKVMHYTNSALNPLVYSVRNPDMRRTMKGIAKKWLPFMHRLPSPMAGRAMGDVRLSNQLRTPERNAGPNAGRVVLVTVGQCNGGAVLSRPTSLVQITSHA